MTKMKNNDGKTGKKTVLRRITGIVGYVLIFLIAVLFVFVISYKKNNKIFFVFDRTAVWVMTPSMEPAIPERSFILIKKVETNEIKVGDIIMFKSDNPVLAGAYNTHRVIGISDDLTLFYTKGDANLVADSEPARAENILGIYDRNLPVLSAVGRFIFTGIGTVITLTLIFVIAMIIYLPDIIAATKKKSDELDKIRQKRIDELVAAEVEKLKSENASFDNSAAPSEEESEPAGYDTADTGQDTTVNESEDIQ